MSKYLVILAVIFLTACGRAVEVPPAHVGKILTKNGFAPESVPPSKFRLPVCISYCDKLVVMEASDRGFKEVMQLFMPNDKLNLSIEVRGTLSVPSDSKTVDAIFDRVVASQADDSSFDSMIKLNQVYETYGQQAVRGVVRSELVKYTIADILEKREAISQAVNAALTSKLKETNVPLVVSRFELADVQPPEVIVNAQQAAKEREVAIQKAEADARVQLVQAEKDLEIAKKNRLVARENALAIAEQNEIAAKSVTPELLAYRKLEVTERIFTQIAQSNNSMIIPADTSLFSDITGDAVLGKILGKEIGKSVGGGNK